MYLGKPVLPNTHSYTSMNFKFFHFDFAFGRDNLRKTRTRPSRFYGNKRVNIRNLNFLARINIKISYYFTLSFFIWRVKSDIINNISDYLKIARKKCDRIR